MKNFQVGKNTMYNLGTKLRARYNDFLNSSYHYTLVEGTSTYLERTKESLQLVLAGLFPVTEELSWNKNLNWTPIATYYNPKGKDKVNKILTKSYSYTVFYEVLRIRINHEKCINYFQTVSYMYSAFKKNCLENNLLIFSQPLLHYIENELNRMS